MKTFRPAPTEAQLRDAYARAQLEEVGISFEQAMALPAIAGSLRRMTEPDRRWAANTLGRGSLRLDKMNKEDQ